jgi:hypothetical protein
MGYLIKAPVGLAMFLGGIVLFNVKLVALLQTGTCASGNTPYQIAQPCPSGTGTDILLLMAGIFGGLIGGGIFAVRGNPPWDKDRPLNTGSDFSFGLFAWGLFFSATGATALITGITDEALSAGSDFASKFVGGLFLLMGLPALAICIRQLVKGLGKRDERPPAAPAGIGGMASGGVMSRMSAGLGGEIAKLERLQKLRQSGALTDAEFEREKAKILAEG